MRFALRLIALATVSASLTGCCQFGKREAPPEIAPATEAPTR